jgi:hypothetical protein
MTSHCGTSIALSAGRRVLLGRHRESERPRRSSVTAPPSGADAPQSQAPTHRHLSRV